MSDPRPESSRDFVLQRRVYELALRRAFGDLAAEENAELDRLVCENPAARRWFVDAMIETAALHYHAAGVTASGEPQQVLAAKVKATDSARQSVPDATSATAHGGTVAPESSPTTILGFLGASVRSIVSVSSSFSPLIMLAAVITASLSWAAILLWVIPLWQDRNAPIADGLQPMGRLVASSKCQWRGGKPPGPNAEMAREPWELLDGSAEILLRSGTSIVIYGPVRLSFETPSRLRLERGRLVASVPQHDHGFTVVTPLAEVIDLGTEFGVEVDAKGNTEVHTLSGLVAVKSARGAVQNAPSAGTRVSGGEAVRIDASGEPARSIPYSGERFAQAVPGGSLRIRAAQGGDQSPAVPRETAAQVTREFTGAVYLSNLFDDQRGRDLAAAMLSDEFRAVPEVGDLGVERILYAGAARKNICPGIQFDFSSLGWQDLRFGQVANDAWTSKADSPDLGGIRARGAKLEQTAPRIADGIGTHANCVLTFDLDELRSAGLWRDRDLTFVCDQVGISDSGFGETGSIHVAVLTSDRQQVRSAWLDGQTATVVQRNGVWHFADKVGSPLRANGRFFSLRLPVARHIRYLTLVPTSAGDGHGSDQAAWFGVRLEVSP